MKAIDGELLLEWLEKNRSALEICKQHIGNLFWTGADTTYQKVIDYVSDLVHMSDVSINFTLLDETD